MESAEQVEKWRAEAEIGTGAATGYTYVCQRARDEEANA